MTITMRILACASALALSTPAMAQQTQRDMPDGADGTPEMNATSRSEQGSGNMMGRTWQDVSTPSVRFIQRDSEGNIVFDSAGAELGTGVSDPDLAAQIDEADGETPFATDQARQDWMLENGMREMQGEEMIVIRNMPSERREDLAASPQPTRMDGQGSMSDGSSTGGGSQGGMMASVDDRPAPATDGQYGQTMTTANGMQFDVEGFARDMFEQGYRRGYVSGLTEMRARAVQQMQNEPRVQQRAAFELQARQQREAMNDVLGEGETQRAPQMQRREDGTTVIMLPPGVTPQQFMQALGAQR
jgi:hypothetical protein